MVRNIIEKMDERTLIYYSQIFSVIWAILMTIDIITTQIDLKIGHGLIEGNEIMVGMVKYPLIELILKYLLVLLVFLIFYKIITSLEKELRNYFWILYIFTMSWLSVYFAYLAINNAFLGFMKLKEIGFF